MEDAPDMDTLLDELEQRMCGITKQDRCFVEPQKEIAVLPALSNKDLLESERVITISVVKPSQAFPQEPVTSTFNSEELNGADAGNCIESDRKATAPKEQEKENDDDEETERLISYLNGFSDVDAYEPKVAESSLSDDVGCTEPSHCEDAELSAAMEVAEFLVDAVCCELDDELCSRYAQMRLNEANYSVDPPIDSMKSIEEKPIVESPCQKDVTTVDDQENEESEKERLEAGNDCAFFESLSDPNSTARSDFCNEYNVENIPSTDVEAPRSRFNSIATVHVLPESDSEENSQESHSGRLTESELKLGKTSPYWIPDTDCCQCMLCTVKFTLLTRRHHCRACGRVLCGSCCSERAVLQYTSTDNKKTQPSRVCKPCAKMLARIKDYEDQEDGPTLPSTTGNGELLEEGATSSSQNLPTTTAPKSVLKSRSGTLTNDGHAETGQQTVAIEHQQRRSVVFRDGIRPGTTSENGDSRDYRSTTFKPKKRTKKRYSVVRRIVELRMEDELACALPSATRTALLVMKPDSLELLEPTDVLKKLKSFEAVSIVLKKNLNCAMQLVDVGPQRAWTVSTEGFAQIGLDELFFSWTMKETEESAIFSDEPCSNEDATALLPFSVFHRISQMYSNSTDMDGAGVRRVGLRMARIHSVPVAAEPLTKHILFFPPTVQNFSLFRIPKGPFLIACFLHENELQWAMAAPNRLLLRLGLNYSWYPTPIVNFLDRPSMYSLETSNTVLKVFTDFRSWTFRIRHIFGCTVSLSRDLTVIRITRSSLNDLLEVIQWNRMMLAWSCDISLHDDGHLICDETEPGVYTTCVFSRFEGKRNSTGASFVILDGGLKVQSLQVTVVEDGVTIRVQPDRLESILSSLSRGEDVTERYQNQELRIEFVNDNYNASPYGPKSVIDEHCLLNKYQYGLSLERALTQVFQVQGIPDFGIRLSQAYNLNNGRFTPEDEPKVFGIIEMIAKECSSILGFYLPSLIDMGINNVSIRLLVSAEQVEYDVSQWVGLNAENNNFRQSMDQMIPMLYSMIEVVPDGFEVEFVLSIVSTKPLPV